MAKNNAKNKSDTGWSKFVAIAGTCLGVCIMLWFLKNSISINLKNYSRIVFAIIGFFSIFTLAFLVPAIEDCKKDVSKITVVIVSTLLTPTLWHFLGNSISRFSIKNGYGAYAFLIFTAITLTFHIYSPFIAKHFYTRLDSIWYFLYFV